MLRASTASSGLLLQGSAGEAPLRVRMRAASTKWAGAAFAAWAVVANGTQCRLAKA